MNRGRELILRISMHLTLRAVKRTLLEEESSQKGGGATTPASGRRKMLWLTIFLIIVVADFVIPYAILKDVSSFYASYTFWSLLTVITMILGYIYSAGWEE